MTPQSELDRLYAIEHRLLRQWQDAKARYVEMEAMGRGKSADIYKLEMNTIKVALGYDPSDLESEKTK